MKKLTLLLLLTAIPAAYSADVYKWTDAQGKIHFSNVPPKQGSPSERVAQPKAPIVQGTGLRPAEVQLLKEIEQRDQQTQLQQQEQEKERQAKQTQAAQADCAALTQLEQATRLPLAAARVTAKQLAQEKSVGGDYETARKLRTRQGRIQLQDEAQEKIQQNCQKQ